jgi:hypothetical protein
MDLALDLDSIMQTCTFFNVNRNTYLDAEFKLTFQLVHLTPVVLRSSNSPLN